MNALRILHVDDDAALTTSFEIVLEATGRYVVREESSRIDAIDTVHRFRPDLIVLDKSLDDAMGEDVTAKLQEDLALRSVPIAFITGGTTCVAAIGETVPPLVAPCELLGFVDHLQNFNALCVGC
jgi:CheY-like chemotaxis protein